MWPLPCLYLVPRATLNLAYQRNLEMLFAYRGPVTLPAIGNVNDELLYMLTWPSGERLMVNAPVTSNALVYVPASVVYLTSNVAAFV